MAANIEQLHRHAQSSASPRGSLMIDLRRRARSLEEELTRLADSNASGAELAALLQE